MYFAHVQKHQGIFFAQNLLVQGDLKSKWSDHSALGITDADIRTRRLWDSCSLHVAEGLLVSRACNFRLLVMLWWLLPFHRL